MNLARTYPPPELPQGVGPRPSPSIDGEGIGVARLSSNDGRYLDYPAMRALVQACMYSMPQSFQSLFEKPLKLVIVSFSQRSKAAYGSITEADECNY